MSVKVKKYQGLYSSNYQYPLHPLGASIPVCTCPSGYVGNGYGPNGCTQISNICQTNNPCMHGQCVVSLCYMLLSFSTLLALWHIIDIKDITQLFQKLQDEAAL